MVQINDDYYEDLNPEIMTRILDDLKNDKEILKIAVSGHEQAFHYVPEKWRTDKELLDILLLKKVAQKNKKPNKYFLYLF
jgi:hypothetical protein